MKALKRTLLVTLCAFVPACASTATNAASAKRQPTTVVVDNQALLDMTIYVLNGGQRIRLGTATGLSTTRLTIPSSVVLGARTLRFIADPIGGNRSPVSEEINVEEGDEIGLRIPPV